MSTKRSAGSTRAGKSKRATVRTMRTPPTAVTPAVKKKTSKGSAKAPAKAKPKTRVAKAATRIVAAGPASPRSRSKRRAQSATKGTGSDVTCARFTVGDVVRHKIYPFRGVIFDIDPVFANTEEWWLSIPEQMRPRKNQPFYHLLAENSETEYIAYVSEQNLVRDTTGAPVRHPQVSEYFIEDEDGRYRPVFMTMLN